jgi:hypothetical protein
MIKSLITASLVVTGLAHAAPVACLRNVPVPVVTDVAWTKMAKFQKRYSDLYYRCGSVIGQLNQAEMKAKRFLRSGSLGQATETLVGSLMSFAARLPPPNPYESYPLTMESIRQGSELMQTAVAATEKDQSMNSMMATQVKYNIVSRIYKTIHKAYDELDQVYYMQTNNSCYGGCDELPDGDAYRQGVADLAKEFLNIQEASAEAQGTDKVEIAMTAVTAKAAKQIILASPVRRFYSCAIMELHAIQVEASTFLCDGNPGFNQASFVDELRERLEGVRFPAEGCGYHHGHHRNYEQEQSDEDEE